MPSYIYRQFCLFQIQKKAFKSIFSYLTFSFCINSSINFVLIYVFDNSPILIWTLLFFSKFLQWNQMVSLGRWITPFSCIYDQFCVMCAVTRHFLRTRNAIWALGRFSFEFLAGHPLLGFKKTKTDFEIFLGGGG